MKKSTSPAEINGDKGRKRAQNKDNLDNRSNEEQDTKGQQRTHNEKQTKEKHLKQKK